MSFKVGDLVEVVSVCSMRNLGWIGCELVVTEVGIPTVSEDGDQYLGIMTSPHPGFEWGPWKPDQLRLRRPPFTDTPAIDHVPCEPAEPEFTQWLRGLTSKERA